MTLINVGATEATIFEWGIRFLVEQSTRSLPPLSKFAATTNRIEGRFGPGISTTFKNVTDGTVISDALGLEIQARRSTLYCLGYVHYMDAAKGVRTTAFCRALRFGESAGNWREDGRFRVVDDPDYEYES